jgi:N-acylneuraminate cytidylyltransferase
MGECVIIPARGGSKRVPRKNVIDFMGKPLICWTIQAAQEALDCDIYVSTDSEEIADVAREYGADVVMRRSGNDDLTTVQQATIITLEQIVDEGGEEYDTVIQLMANCPLRDASDIEDAYRQFTNSGADFQLSCFRYGWMNPWWALKCAGKPLFPDEIKIRSQDLDPLYCPTGAIWIAKVKPLIKQGTFYGKNYAIHPMPWQHAIDIDEYEDLKFARALKMMEDDE